MGLCIRENPDGSIARWQGKAVITYALSNSRQPRYAVSSDKPNQLGGKEPSIILWQKKCQSQAL